MDRTKLIIVNGLSATGKTTLATKIARDLHLPLFTKDDFKELLADSSGLINPESSQMFGKASYSILFLIAQRLLEKKVSLIIEGNFTFLGKETKDFIEYLHGAHINVVEVLCFTDGDLLVSRFLGRKRHAIHHALAPDAHIRFAETLRIGKVASLGVGQCLEIDTSDFSKIPYEDVLRKIDLN